MNRQIINRTHIRMIKQLKKIKILKNKWRMFIVILVTHEHIGWCLTKETLHCMLKSRIY